MHNPASNNKLLAISITVACRVKLTCYCMNTVCLRPTMGANRLQLKSCRGEIINKGSQPAGQKMAMLLLCICISQNYTRWELCLLNWIFHFLVGQRTMKSAKIPSCRKLIGLKVHTHTDTWYFVVSLTHVLCGGEMFWGCIMYKHLHCNSIIAVQMWARD